MSQSPGKPGLSPELHAAIFHFSVFGTSGIAAVYFSIWLSHRGISPDEIGIINAVPVLVMLAVNIFVGRIADRASDWRSVVVVLALVAGAAPIGLFFVNGFWGVLLVWTMAMLPVLSLVPVLDAATLRMTQRRGTDFAGIRAWGTVGYMIVTALSGPIIAIFGDAAFVPLFAALALCRAALSLQLPKFRGPPPAEGVAAAKPAMATAGRLRDVLKPWFVLTLLGLGVVYSTHGAVSAFAALLWSEQGISEVYIGPLFALMAAAEATMMFVWSRLKLKASARHLILIAALVAAARWSAFAFAMPLWLLFALQLLHAFTFAMSYFGGIYFIANWTSEEIAAEAQGFAYVLQQGMTVVVLVAMGWCVAVWGTGAWLAVGGFALVGAGLVLLSLRLKPLATERTTEIPPALAARGEDLLP